MTLKCRHDDKFLTSAVTSISRFWSLSNVFVNDLKSCNHSQGYVAQSSNQEWLLSFNSVCSSQNLFRMLQCCFWFPLSAIILAVRSVSPRLRCVIGRTRQNKVSVSMLNLGITSNPCIWLSTLEKSRRIQRIICLLCFLVQNQLIAFIEVASSCKPTSAEYRKHSMDCNDIISEQRCRKWFNVKCFIVPRLLRSY